MEQPGQKRQKKEKTIFDNLNYRPANHFEAFDIMRINNILCDVMLQVNIATFNFLNKYRKSQV